MNQALALCLLLAVTDAPLSGSPDAGQALVRGDAFDLGSGARAYSEEHRETYLAGRLLSMRTLYRDPAGTLVAERDLDFSSSSIRPAYTFKDARTGHEEGAAFAGGRIRMHYRASAAVPDKEKSLKIPEPAVIDGGFHPFLKENWSALMAGKKVSFNFVVPSRLDYFRFVAYADPARDPADGTQRVIVARPENRMLRLLVEPIVARYDTASLRMLEYRGLSNLPGPDGGTQKVRLMYQEPGL